MVDEILPDFKDAQLMWGIDGYDQYTDSIGTWECTLQYMSSERKTL